MAGLRRIRTAAKDYAASSMPGATVLVGGSSATLVDFDDIILQRLPLIMLVVLGLWKWVWRRVPGPVLGTACALLFVTAQVLSPDTAKAFVYFQF